MNCNVVAEKQVARYKMKRNLSAQGRDGRNARNAGISSRSIRVPHVLIDINPLHHRRCFILSIYLTNPPRLSDLTQYLMTLTLAFLIFGVGYNQLHIFGGPSH